MTHAQPEPGGAAPPTPPPPAAGDVPATSPGAGVARGPRAGFGPRLGAALLDGLILVVPYIVLAAIIGEGIAYLLLLIAQVAYFTYFEGGETGQTIGKRALKIRVIDHATGGPLGYARAFVRWIARILSALPLYLGYLWMLWDKEKQTWHDKLATTVVVPEADYPVAR